MGGGTWPTGEKRAELVGGRRAMWGLCELSVSHN